MAKAKRTGLLESADYPEDLVNVVLDTALAVATFPSVRFSVEPFSKMIERRNGADAILIDKIGSFKPFYMQFKKPSAYPDHSNSSIIKDRKKLGLVTSPKSLFFPLREKQKDHADYQHNILMDLRMSLLSNGYGDAAYVCPLFLNRDTYRANMQIAALALHFDRWEGGAIRGFRDTEIASTSGLTSLRNVPTLNEHVCIPPHDYVTTAKHSYSFTEQGTDLGFHSPLAIAQQPIPLIGWLNPMYESFVSRKSEIDARESGHVLANVLKATRLNADVHTRYDMETWFRLGAYLKQTYNIHQYAFVRWKE